MSPGTLDESHTRGLENLVAEDTSVVSIESVRFRF